MPSIRNVLARLVLPALAAAALWGLSRCVPFEPTSYAAWTGIVLAVIAIAGLVRPARWLWLPTRLHALAALVAGSALAAAALAWPVSTTRSTRPLQRLDDYLPEYQAVEYHEAHTRAPVARVAEAVHQVTLRDMPAATLLLWIRSLGQGPITSAPGAERSLLDTMLRPGSGFLELDASDARDRLYGMVGAPWKGGTPPEVRSGEEFKAFQEPGAVRVAFDFQIVEEPGGLVHLSTETRILGTDPAARATFARYWRLVYPGSAIIRRVWLDAIVARAERAP